MVTQIISTVSGEIKKMTKILNEYLNFLKILQIFELKIELFFLRCWT